MKSKILNILKKIIIFQILIIPNIVNADFFKDITAKIVDNPKRLSYGISVADMDHNEKYEFIVTGFGYPNLALSYDNGKLINIASQKIFSDEFRKTIGVAACDVDRDGFEEIYFLNTDTYSGTKKYSDRLIDLEGNNFTTVIKHAQNYASIYGHCFMILDKPNIQPQTTLAGCGLSREFGHALDDLPDEKYNDKDITALAKKYNAQVLVDETIIGVPYGDADDFESKYGVVFDTVTKQSRPFDIEIGYGGKYRFKCGIAYKGRAIFLPSGTPGLPIISVATDGTFHATRTDNSKLFGRPIIYKEKLYTLVFNTIDNSHSLVEIDEWLRVNEVIKI